MLAGQIIFSVLRQRASASPLAVGVGGWARRAQAWQRHGLRVDKIYLWDYIRHLTRKDKMKKYSDFIKWLNTCPVPYVVDDLKDFDDDSIAFLTSENTDKHKDDEEEN